MKQKRVEDRIELHIPQRAVSRSAYAIPKHPSISCAQNLSVINKIIKN